MLHWPSSQQLLVSHKVMAVNPAENHQYLGSIIHALLTLIPDVRGSSVQSKGLGLTFATRGGGHYIIEALVWSPAASHAQTPQ